MVEERLKHIQQFLYTQGASNIQALVEATRSSPATIRRDLARLEEAGLVERTHGGARLAEASGLEVAFGLREYKQLEQKRAIAKAAYKRLRPESTVLMDAGTTVLQLAKAIRINPLPLTVITNGLALAQELIAIAGVKVIFVGGLLRDDNLSSVGPYAEALLDEFSCDQLFLGATAISLEGQMQTLDAAEAAINKKMLGRARERILLADSSKFGHRAPFKVSSLSSLTQVISDSGLGGSWPEHLRKLEVGLETVKVGP